MPNLRPTDAFMPNRFPLGQHKVYAARAEAEGKVSRASDRPEVAVVFGG